MLRVFCGGLLMFAVHMQEEEGRRRGDLESHPLDLCLDTDALLPACLAWSGGSPQGSLWTGQPAQL